MPSPLPDQTAVRITGELVKIFSTFGHPEILHSDQGRNFESSILAQTLQAFGVHKSRTTAYHPQGDGMVERFNRSLLQLLRAYVDTQSEWEHYLLLVLYAYRTSTHSSTGVSPFLLMYGCNPSSTPFSKSNKFDSLSYPAHLQAKLAELHDFVEANLTEAARHQKCAYDQHTSVHSFSAGEPLWLSAPTAGKLEPGGKEIGSSNPSKVQQIWKSRMEKPQKWFTQIDCNIAMFQAHLIQIWMLPTNSGMHQQLTMYTCPLPCQLSPDVIHYDSDMHQIDGDSEARGRASAQGRASVAKLELS